MLAIPGAVALITMAVRGARLLLATSRLDRQWSAQAERLPCRAFRCRFIVWKIQGR